MYISPLRGRASSSDVACNVSTRIKVGNIVRVSLGVKPSLKHP
jgi:hypothetical protein